MSNCSRQSLLNWCLVHTKGTLKVNADEKRSHRVQLEGGLVPKFTKKSKVLLENSNCRGFFTVYRAKKNTMGHSICRTKLQWAENIFEFAFHVYLFMILHFQEIMSLSKVESIWLLSGKWSCDLLTKRCPVVLSKRL